MTHSRMVPPEDPSRAMASASATQSVSEQILKDLRLTVLDKLNSLLLIPAFTVGSVAVTVDVR